MPHYEPFIGKAEVARRIGKSEHTVMNPERSPEEQNLIPIPAEAGPLPARTTWTIICATCWHCRR